MASKRTATTDLNDKNWDKEEKPEDAGTFKKAPQEILQKRVIKTAKRRNPQSSDVESDTKNVFGSFSGFTKAPTTSTGFAFLNNLSAHKDETPTVNGVNSSSSIFTPPTSISNSTHKVPENKSSNNEEDNEYFAKLKGLNESVSNWIKKHVDTNPFINLKPIFKDYEKYFDELESLKSKKPLTTLFSKTKDDSTTLKSELSSFVFKSSESAKDSTDSKSTPQFSFGVNSNKKENDVTSTATPTFNFASSSVTTSSPTFSFGSDTKTISSSGFTFGSPTSKPFTFKNVAKSKSSEEVSEEQEEEEPPKVEFTPVVEDGHTYTVRCKVFVKNQDTFGDRGVGTLYLKPVPDLEKTQVVVRADTNLGNLLCNFILSKAIPVKRMGKKDVMLVCLPTPESKPPPVPILLRVKSPEQADELLAELDKHKK